MHDGLQRTAGRHAFLLPPTGADRGCDPNREAESSRNMSRRIGFNRLLKFRTVG
jgi:hypothetical protein